MRRSTAANLLGALRIDTVVNANVMVCIGKCYFKMTSLYSFISFNTLYAG